MTPTNSQDTKKERVNNIRLNDSSTGPTSTAQPPRGKNVCGYHHLKNYQAEQYITMDIIEVTEIAVSDGSFKDEFGTASVIIEGN